MTDSWSETIAVLPSAIADLDAGCKDNFAPFSALILLSSMGSAIALLGVVTLGNFSVVRFRDRLP